MANTATYTQADLEALPTEELGRLATASNGGVPITDHDFTLLYQTHPGIDVTKWSEAGDYFETCRLGLYTASGDLIRAYTFPKGTSKERAITIVFLLTNG